MFRSETEFAFAAYRTQLFNLDDLDNVKKVQAGYMEQSRFRPFSASPRQRPRQPLILSSR